MRFSSSVVALALPLLAGAAENPFEQYKAQFQNVLDQIGSYLPNPSRHDPVDAAAAKAGAKKMDVLTLGTWEEQLYAPVKAGAKQPEEWWVLITGRNKTCFGHCLKLEAAFNETAVKLAALPKHPHVGYVNCDDQPILCHSWGASAGSIWVIEMLPKPAPIEIYTRRMNLTTTDAKTLLDLYTSPNKDTFKVYEGYFHPFDGVLAKNQLAVPAAYVIWVLGVVPSWAVMLLVSMASRSMMSRRMPGGADAARGAPGAPRAAQPGDATF